MQVAVEADSPDVPVTPESQVAVGRGISLSWDSFGAADAPVVLLIMGLGTQMVAWPESLCRRIAAQGFRVVRFDNRDIGLSTKLEDAKTPGRWKLMLLPLLRMTPRAPYQLQEMADDAAGLLDALNIERAHIVGASMGGMIAQLLAHAHPTRVHSLTSVMSTSGKRGLPGPSKPVLKQMFLTRPNMASVDEVIEHAVTTWQLIGSPGFPTDRAVLHERVSAWMRRSFYPVGFQRQLAAIIADGDRSSRLRSLDLPALVIHGKQDPLIPADCGIHTAQQIPGARLELIEGMGHDMPEPLVPTLAELIVAHARTARS